MDWTDAIGMIGVVVILVVYLMLQAGKIDANDFTYSFLNLLGALLILFSLMSAWNWSSVIIEVFWALISLYGMYRGFRQGKTIKN